MRHPGLVKRNRG